MRKSANNALLDRSSRWTMGAVTRASTLITGAMRMDRFSALASPMRLGVSSPRSNVRKVMVRTTVVTAMVWA